MPGSGRGSKWLPLHCVLLLGPKYPGWWWPLAEPLVRALCKAYPGACEQRVLEGSPHPCGQLPLELAVTKGWDARVVDVVQKTYPKAAETLDPVKVPGGILKKAFPPPGKGLPDQEFLNELGGPEVLSNAVHKSNRRDASYAIDATPARWRAPGGLSPLDSVSTVAFSSRKDLVKKYRVHSTHWLIFPQVQ